MTSNQLIYHYTTIKGLIGIITKSELWASDCRFLNDGTELTYALDLFFSEVDKNLKEDLKFVDKGSGGLSIPFRTPSESSDVFIVCFCENGDLLSQWRGYGQDQGYAIGFDKEKLEDLGLGKLVKVYYGLENLNEFFSSELSLAKIPTAHPGNVEFFESEHILPRLAEIKNPVFAEEHEWRLISHASKYSESKKPEPIINFRESVLGPVGYIVHKITSSCIREIIIGPGAHKETRKSAASRMIKYHSFTNINIRTSKIPLR